MGYKILTHTADFLVTFSGDSVESMEYTILEFFKNEIIESCKKTEDFFITEIEEEDFAFSVISILNEIIFNLEQSKAINRIKFSGKNSFKFKRTLEFVKCSEITVKTELKAATYHNIRKINISEKPLKLSVLFDV